MTTATRPLDIRICLTDPGEGLVEINGVMYVAVDRVGTVTLRKMLCHGGDGTEYTLRVGSRGCYGCTCPDAKYRRRECKHVAAANKFLDASF